MDEISIITLALGLSAISAALSIAAIVQCLRVLQAAKTDTKKETSYIEGTRPDNTEPGSVESGAVDAVEPLQAAAFVHVDSDDIREYWAEQAAKRSRV